MRHLNVHFYEMIGNSNRVGTEINRLTDTNMPDE